MKVKEKSMMTLFQVNIPFSVAPFLSLKERKVADPFNENPGKANFYQKEEINNEKFNKLS